MVNGTVPYRHHMTGSEASYAFDQRELRARVNFAIFAPLLNIRNIYTSYKAKPTNYN